MTKITRGQRGGTQDPDHYVYPPQPHHRETCEISHGATALMGADPHSRLQHTPPSAQSGPMASSSSQPSYAQPAAYQMTPMELDTPSSPKNSATPHSTMTSNHNSHFGGPNDVCDSETSDPGYGFTTAHSTLQGSNHSRSCSDPELPFVTSTFLEQWQRDLPSASGNSDALGPTPRGSTNQTHWIQSFDADLTDTILPRDLHHMYDLQEPWTCFDGPIKPPVQADMPMVFGSDDGLPKPSSSTDKDQVIFSDADYRAGVRSGPLSVETRQNANDVRNVGSCLRCFVMRESCDVGYPCRNCHQKEARSWKFGKRCIRPRLPQRAKYLIPEILVSRLKKAYVSDFINQRGWRAQTNLFALPLEIGLGEKLDLPVREYLPLLTSTQYRAAYLTESTTSGISTHEVYEYDLPVVISCYDEHKVAQQIRYKLHTWFKKTLQTLNDENSDWSGKWFDNPLEVFECEVMRVICGYYQHNLEHQHDLLKEALALSFFNYIMSHSFSVPEEDITSVLKQMERAPEILRYNLRWVCPSTINRYIKMLLRPPLMDVAQRTLKGLETLLLDTDNRSAWRRDIVFAVGFILIAYLGKTQAALIQAGHQQEPHESAALPAFDLKEAVVQAQAIEYECVDVVIGYLKQFMSPSARRKHYSSVSPSKSRKVRPGDAEAQKHAENFDFMKQILLLRDQFAHTIPENLNLNSTRVTVNTFMEVNTHRLCWKFFQEVIGDTTHTSAPVV